MIDKMLQNIPPVVKNIVLLNVLFYLAQWMLPNFMGQLALYPFSSDLFRPWQLATHFFMHSTNDVFHLLFNLFGIVIFGSVLERTWGMQRFLLFYFVTGFGAAILHAVVVEWRIGSIEAILDETLINEVKRRGTALWFEGKNYTNPLMGQLNAMLNIPVLGASGAMFGLLVAFGYLFPNTQLMLLFPPVPIRAKYFVLGYIAIELYQGFQNNPYDNVAHFAHLGGALFGFLMLMWWKKNNRF